MAGEIVLGYDGEPGSRAALQTAVADRGRVQTPARDRVRVRTAADRWRGRSTSPRPCRTSARSSRTTRSSCARGIDPSVEVKVELVNDRPADALLRAADQYDALAIVVGAAARGPIAGAMLGSVTYQVVHRSRRPVVVVPAPEA